jgi:hypothetical protein
VHRSQALYRAFTMKRARGAGARNGAVSALRDAGELMFVGCDRARGGAPGTTLPAIAEGTDRSSRARYGVVPRTGGHAAR